MANDVVHWRTLWGGLLLFGVFLLLALVLGMDLPNRYPMRFDSSGTPTHWGEGPGSWILLVVVGAFCYGQGFLFQRFVVTDPDSTLLNLPQRELFRSLPREQKIPVVRRVNRMLGLLNILTLMLFCTILLTVYIAATWPYSPLRQLGTVLTWVTVGAVALLSFAEIVGVRRMIGRALLTPQPPQGSSGG
jgi:uncharacterized membrane protein